jgi:hypothetical protein
LESLGGWKQKREESCGDIWMSPLGVNCGLCQWNEEPNLSISGRGKGGGGRGWIETPIIPNLTLGGGSRWFQSILNHPPSGFGGMTSRICLSLFAGWWYFGATEKAAYTFQWISN